MLVLGLVAVIVLVLPSFKEFSNEATGRLSAPATVAGLTKSDNAQLQSTADQMNTLLKSKVKNSTSTVAAFYTDPASPTKVVMIAGVTGTIANPKQELEDTFSGAATTGLTIDGAHTVDAGPMSGEARCGNGKTGEVTLSICAWADHGSVGAVYFFNRDVDSSAVLFKQIRNEILKRD